jgi:putative protease
MKIPKILAPAGSFASLQTALKAGCDSVYFGIGDFNMRATASVNFKEEDLPEIVKLCKSKNVETCLTVNNLLFDSDLELMRRTVDLAEKHGVDAIIAADMATIIYAQQKNIGVHISTQVSISNFEEVKFYAQYADRLVLARELTLEQVAKIIQQIKKNKITGPAGELVEIEVFGHGALCVSVSGRCAMSLFHYNRSASRGNCAQVCRHRFRVTDLANGKALDIDNNFIMSSADLCTIGLLSELVKAGVDVLKFEGRGRPPEYVDTVISTYRKALKDIKNDQYTPQKIDQYLTDLGTVFNRGLSDGFYMGRKFDEWAKGNGSKATHKKIQLGIVEKYYPKISVAQVLIQTPHTAKTGSELLITGPKTGLVRHTLEKFKIDEDQVTQAQQGDVITFKIKEPVRKKDEVYLWEKVK